MIAALSQSALRLLAGVLSVVVGLVALRYALPAMPGLPPEIATNRMIGLLPFHALTGALALLIGPFQFLRGRAGPGSSWHRWEGRAYAVTCLVSAPVGLVLALGTSAGPVASAGFGLLAAGWFAATALGWRAVLRGRLSDHRAWMIRSYAFAFAAVTLRLYLPAAVVAAGMDYAVAYPAIAFLCWVPNLIVAEAIIRRLPPLPAGFGGRAPA